MSSLLVRYLVLPQLTTSHADSAVCNARVLGLFSLPKGTRTSTLSIAKLEMGPCCRTGKYKAESSHVNQASAGYEYRTHIVCIKLAVREGYAYIRVAQRNGPERKNVSSDRSTTTRRASPSTGEGQVE